MSTEIQIEIENLKCGGCAKSILKGLASMSDISNVVVDQAGKLVSFTGDAHVRESVVSKLRAMGFPEKGVLHGFDAGLANAKPFVSCAMSRMS